MRWIFDFVLGVTLVMSAAAFIAFFIDKRCAVRGAWRIRERTLLTLCALMGAPGGLAAMRIFRHKTKKPPFPYAVPLLCALELGALIALFAFC